MRRIWFMSVMVLVGGLSLDTMAAKKRGGAAPIPDEGMTGKLEGKVLETMDSGGYTYVHVDTGGETLWAAAQISKVSAGDTIQLPEGFIMKDFHSSTLDRTFESILFVSRIDVKGAPADSDAGTQPARPKTPARDLPPDAIVGQILETMDSGRYTYLRLETENDTFWAAAPQFEAKAGDTVAVPKGMLMTGFHSPTLDRTFDTIYFVGDAILIDDAGASQDAPKALKPDEPAPVASPSAGQEVSSEEGLTVAQLYTRKDALAGKKVTVTGKVIKFTQDVMHKNWIHIQDAPENHSEEDLTLTTDAIVELGDQIKATGMVTLDKDFGYGYSYDVLVEDAVVEKQ